MNGSLTVNRAGDLCRFQPEILFCKFADVRKKIVCGIGKRRENDDLLITGIDRMLDFLPDQIEQCLQLRVMLRCDVCNHEGQQFQIFRITFKLTPP